MFFCNWWVWFNRFFLISEMLFKMGCFFFVNSVFFSNWRFFCNKWVPFGERVRRGKLLSFLRFFFFF